jgi:hypothetical protein
MGQKLDWDELSPVFALPADSIPQTCSDSPYALVLTKQGVTVAIVSINIELIAEIPLTINESSRQEGQSYVDLITEAATAFMENNDLNQLDFQVKVVGDVIAAE